MKIKICIVSMMMSLSIMAIAQDNHVGEIEDLVNASLYQQALVELDRIQVSDDQVELQKLRAISNLEIEQYAEAEVLYLSISQRDEGVDVSNNLGLTYLRQLKFVEAIQIFQNTIRRFPEDAAAYKNLGDAYLFLAHSTYKKGAEAVENSNGLQFKYEAITESLKMNTTTAPLPELIEAAPELESVSNKSIEPDTKDEYLSEERTEQINRLLHLWAKAKSNVGSEEFYSYYDSRELAIVASKNPDDGVVRALEPSVQLISNDRASVVFDEWTGPYSKRIRLFKQLNLALMDSEWKITGEEVIHVY
jgi:tetratricopeptide (TPR) repeat protein